MPHCAASGCHFQSKGNKGTDISIHSFPQEKEIREQWVNACGRVQLPKDPRLCSRHFSPDAFVDSHRPRLFKELIGSSGYKRRLKPNAVPTIFSYDEPKQPRLKSANRESKHQKQDTLDDGAQVFEVDVDIDNDEHPLDTEEETVRAPGTTTEPIKMYCPFCGHQLRCASTLCGLCGKNIKFLFEIVKRDTSEGTTGKSELPTFQESKALKKEKKLALKKKKKELRNKRPVKIYVGMMVTKDGELKAVRGMVLPIAVPPGVDAEELCEAAELKMRDFDKNLQGGPYFLLYPDGTKIVNIPGTDRPFTLKAYKDALGKAYQRITVYICTVEDFYSQDFSTDSSDSEAALSDTADSPGTSRGTMDTACNRYSDNRHQSTPTSIPPTQSVNPFGLYKADLQLLPTDKENVKTIKKEESSSPHQEDVKPPHIIKKEESSSPHQEDLKPPHIIKKEEIELAIPRLDPDLYLPLLTDIKTENSSDTDDSEDWK